MINLKDTDNTALGIGITFLIVFWIAFDSLALGIAMGLSLGAAYATSVKIEQERNLAPGHDDDDEFDDDEPEETDDSDDTVSNRDV